MEEKPSAWVCCSCSSPNFDDDVCFICGHQMCDKCKKLSDEETQQIIDGEEKASTWLIGQKMTKQTFNNEAYEKNQKETQLLELQEEIESRLEDSGEKKDVQRKKR